MSFTPFGPPRFDYWLPSDDGFAGANDDPSGASGGGLQVAGTLYMARLPVRQATLITNLFVDMTVLGADTGTGSFFAGLISAGGLLLSGSANLRTSVITPSALAPVKCPLTTPQPFADNLPPAQWPWAAFLSNLTGPQPTFLRMLNSAFNSPQATTQAPFRWGAFTAVGTSLPSSVTMANMAATAFSNWVAWS